MTIYLACLLKMVVAIVAVHVLNKDRFLLRDKIDGFKIYFIAQHIYIYIHAHTQIKYHIHIVF